jgi:predicted NAD/FAD-binding protein
MIQTAPPPRQRIAIIGSGISGLTAAHLLHRDHDITVFEANDYIGGHTNTLDVDLDGESHAVDTGFIVYNEKNYPNFVRLLDRLGVATQPSSMSFSVRCDRTGVEYNGTSLNGLFAQRRNLFRPRFHGMIRDILRFNEDATSFLADGDASMTVGEYLDDRSYGHAFVEHYLLPMGASIWSCPPGTFRQFPMQFVAEFFRNHAMLQIGGRPTWRVIKGGSARYVDVLTRPFRHSIRTSTPVKTVRRLPDTAIVELADGGIERFEQVIFATHSDQALRMLADPTPTETELLGAFPYQRNDVVLHTDASVLPRTRRAWASWNYHVGRGRQDNATITYNMNMLQTLSASRTFCVTLNEHEGIDRERVISRLEYEHPLYTTARKAAQKRHGELINANRTSFCGAYWGYGFHEDGVNSALAVCRAFGRDL